MSRIRIVRTAFLAACVFVAGAIVGATLDRGSLPGSAVAQTERPQIPPDILALVMGIATVAVDSEAAALRINELTDRLAALERRVDALEKPGPR